MHLIIIMIVMNVIKEGSCLFKCTMSFCYFLFFERIWRIYRLVIIGYDDTINFEPKDTFFSRTIDKVFLIFSRALTFDTILYIYIYTRCCIVYDITSVKIFNRLFWTRGMDWFCLGWRGRREGGREGENKRRRRGKGIEELKKKNKKIKRNINKSISIHNSIRKRHSRSNRNNNNNNSINKRSN